MRMISLHTILIASAFLALGMASSSVARAGQSRFCQTGTVSSAQERIDCAGRWVAADGTAFGPRANPYETPKTPHPGFRHTGASANARSTAQSTLYTTQASRVPATIWTPPEPYYDTGAPVVVTRGNQANAFDGSYDVYVPARTTRHTEHACGGYASARHDSVPVVCGQHTATVPLEGCFTLDANDQAHPVACPIANTPVYSSSAHASASVNISSTAFFNTLSGGVGVGAPVFYGGGGAVFTSGGGSVLSRSPLIRFRSRNRGRHNGGHGGCACGGGGMMGMGGGD